MKPEQVYAIFPKHQDHIASLRAIRNALKVTPFPLLLELTRRFRESWRDCDLSQCPTAAEWYPVCEGLGPRRVTKEPRNPERPLYGPIDRARNQNKPDAQLEAETLRKL